MFFYNNQYSYEKELNMPINTLLPDINEGKQQLYSTSGLVCEKNDTMLAKRLAIPVLEHRNNYHR